MGYDFHLVSKYLLHTVFSLTLGLNFRFCVFGGLNNSRKKLHASVLFLNTAQKHIKQIEINLEKTHVFIMIPCSFVKLVHYLKH